ncbi:hypothetical protein EJ08DRAFT_646494 [Tothia fuscella]|uniref:Uncharacterized protein n=1 Tax=Tothia fuscella TaxID=1048955 RepID=A0A9P4NY32_9PEZI|nr:hypothetical protein EJ08DRAFT_646494 [Tothia fuscella]
MSPVLSTIITIAFAIPSLISATSVETWSGTSCNSGDHLYWSGHKGECITLGNVRSLRVNSIDQGCSLTYYSDNYCSDNRIGLGTGYCAGYADGGQVRSFSWDC